MKWVLRLPLLLLILTTSTQFDDQQWKTTKSSSTATLSSTLVTTDGSIHSSAITTSAAMSTASVSKTDAPVADARETSFRLPEAQEAEIADPYDHKTEAVFGGDGPLPASDTTLVPASATYDPPDYYDDETEAVSGGDGPLPASDTTLVPASATYDPPDYDDEMEAVSGDGPLPASDTTLVPESATYDPPDYYDDETEAVSGGDGPVQASDTTLVPESATYDPPDYYDDETEAVRCGDGQPQTSDKAKVVERLPLAERQGQSGDAMSGKDTGPSGSTTAMSQREELAAGAVALPDQRERVNLISWLPSWCRHWPLFGPLGVPRDTQLQAFSEALEEHTVGIDHYWSQPAQSTDDEESSSEEPQTHLMSVAMRQSGRLQEFYQWIFQQLTASVATGVCTPESLDRFLDALEHQANLVNSICNQSPTMRLTCNASNSTIYRNFFWVMDRQSLWIAMFNNWAVSQYNLAIRPRRHPRWWLPTNLLEDIPTLNWSHISPMDQATGVSATGVETVNNGVCSVEEGRGEGRELVVYNENFNEVSTADGYSCPMEQQPESQVKPHNQERKFPTCLLQSISMREYENEQFQRTERTQSDLETGIPTTDPETGMLLQEAGGEMEAGSAPQNRLGQYPSGVPHVNPDQGFYEEHPQNVLQLEERMRASVVVEEEGAQQVQASRPQQMFLDSGNFRSCSETPVLQVLGSDFDPYFLLFVKCNERDEACEPPEKCVAVSSVVSVGMPRGATLPPFPHTMLGAHEMPNGRLSVSLWVPTSCKCIEPLDEN